MNSLLRPLVKYWYLVLGMAVLTSALAGWTRDESFESRARLLFKLGDEFLQSGIGPEARTTGRILLAEAINTEVQILTSYDQYERVVDELGADSFRGPGTGIDPAEFVPDDAVASLRAGLNVKSVENSAVVHLSYEHPDPDRAKLVLSTLIDVYFRERGRILGGRGVGALASVRDESLERYTGARDAYERALDGASARDTESTLGILREQLMELTADARDARRQLVEDERQLAAIATEIESQPASVEIFSEPRANTTLDGARNRLVELRVEEQELLGRYTETSRPVARARSEIAELQNIIRDETSAGERAVRRTGNNPIRDGLEQRRTELVVSSAGLEARLETLAEQRASVRAELLELEARYVEAERLGAELAVAESRFRNVDEQFLANRILSDSEAARGASVRVIERPALPRVAAGLSARERYGLGALVGLLVGWMLAVWIELFKNLQRRAAGGVPDERADRSRDALELERAAELAFARRHAGAATGEDSRRAAALPVLGEFGPVDATAAGAPR